MSEAELIDQYISELQRDANTPPPPGLDNAMADFVHQMTIALEPGYNVPSADQWATLLPAVRPNPEQSPNGYKARMQKVTAIRVHLVTRLVAVLSVFIFGAFLLSVVFRNGITPATIERIRSPEVMNTQVFRRYIDEAWNKGNLDVLGEVFTPEFVRHDPLLSENTAGIEGERALITNFRRALPDLQVAIQDITADGHKVWVQLTITGTHTASFEIPDGRLAPPSGNSVTWTTTGLSHMVDGKIAESWIGSDTLDLLRQLGVYVGLQITIPDGDVEALIDAINAANDEVANPGPDTITLAENGVYTLTEVVDQSSGIISGLPAITSEITLNGNGATIERSRVDTTPDFRILHVLEEGDLRLDAVTISNGNALPSVGGGIWNRGGQMTISNSTFSDNSAGVGGGIGNTGEVTISNSTFSGNISADTGGGIDNRDWGKMIISGSTFSDNSANCGGGIDNVGEMTISNSTFSGNSTERCGGAIGNAGTLTISASTIYGNTAAASGWGGIGDAGNLTIKNTIVANNGGGVGCDGLRGTFTAIGDNLDTDGSCPGFTQVTSAALNLGPLADNGGPVQTHALLPGSVAIDAGTDCTDVDGNPLVRDQRGLERPQDAACDIGAFEAHNADGGS